MGGINLIIQSTGANLTAGSLTHTSSHGGTNGTGGSLGSKTSSVVMSKNSRSPPQKTQPTQSKKIPIPKTTSHANIVRAPPDKLGRRLAGQISTSATGMATMSRLSSQNNRKVIGTPSNHHKASVIVQTTNLKSNRA